MYIVIFVIINIIILIVIFIIIIIIIIIIMFSRYNISLNTTMLFPTAVEAVGPPGAGEIPEPAALCETETETHISPGQRWNRHLQPIYDGACQELL